MSASRGWRPVDKRLISFKDGCNSEQFTQIQRIFGKSGLIKREDVRALREFARFSNDVFWSELADIVDEHAEIEVCEEY